MAITQKRSKRKVSSGRYISNSKKRIYNKGSLPAFTKVGEVRVKVKRSRAGYDKLTLLSSNIINVLNPKTKKSQNTEIITVLESPANRHFIRRNIITKGTIVETKLGKVKITSRPGQEGSLNAILLS